MLPKLNTEDAVVTMNSQVFDANALDVRRDNNKEYFAFGIKK
jgi:hypothetical protein